MKRINRGWLEPKTFIKGFCLFILGVNQKSPAADNFSCTYHARQSIPKQSAAKPFSFFRLINRQPCQKNNRHWMTRQTMADTPRNALLFHRSRRYCVITGNLVSSQGNIGSCGIIPIVNIGKSLEINIKRLDTAIKTLYLMRGF